MRKISTLNYIIKTYQNDQINEETFFDDITSDFNEEMFEPSDNSVNMILNFAKSYEVVSSKSTGNIELVLN